MKHCDWPGLDGVLIPTLREQPPRLQSSTEGESEVRSGRPRAPRGCCHKKEGCMLAQRKQEKPATRCRKWKNFRKSQGRKQSPAIVLPGQPSLRDRSFRTAVQTPGAYVQGWACASRAGLARPGLGLRAQGAKRDTSASLFLTYPTRNSARSCTAWV